MKAWLVTWEWAGDHASVDDPIAAILNPRTSPEKVRQLVELIYANHAYSLSERIQYANNRRFNRFPARFGTIEGISWQGYIICGHNPWLSARKVSDIRVSGDGYHEDKLLWEEISADEMKVLRERAQRNRWPSSE